MISARRRASFGAEIRGVAVVPRETRRSPPRARRPRGSPAGPTSSVRSGLAHSVMVPAPAVSAATSRRLRRRRGFLLGHRFVEGEVAEDLVDGHRAPDREALAVVHAEGRHARAQLVGLDVFRDRLHAHRVGELGDRPHHRFRALVRAGVAHEGAVDLEHRHRQRLQVHERATGPFRSRRARMCSRARAAAASACPRA